MISSKLSHQEIARLVELGEAEAYAEMFLAAPAGVAADFGIRVERVGSAIALITKKMDIMLFNRVIGLGITEPATEAMVDEIVALYYRAGIQSFGVQLSPTARPTALPAWLKTRGLICRDNWAKVYRGVESPPLIPTNLRLECIDPEHAVAFARVACTAFGMPDTLRPLFAAFVGRPGWRHYLAWDDDLPVATGALYIRGQVGWLGVGSTLPSHRRRGAQGAIMAQRIQDALELGCRWLITETGEDTPSRPNSSYHNMVRTGFELAYQRPNYIFEASPASKK
ncbi:MAG: GNAT family N-acetyltransferase [Anaerolineae bacterium]|nr:GNAT family N-acetyltransferase [Anaerolineae bacterium]